MLVLVEDAAEAVMSADAEGSGFVESVIGAGNGWSGRAFASPWCGRCSSQNCSNSGRAWIRCRWFQISGKRRVKPA
jgi:hypothetical protein